MARSRKSADPDPDPAIDPAPVQPDAIPLTRDGFDELWAVVMHIYHSHSPKRQEELGSLLIPAADFLIRAKIALFPLSVQTGPTPSHQTGLQHGPS